MTQDASYVDNMIDARDYLLDFQSDDDFYLLEVIRRKKDNFGMDQQELRLGSWYVTSKEMFDEILDEVETLCASKNARAYLNPNPKSKKKTTVRLMKNLFGMIENDNYQKLFGQMTKAASECPTQSGRSKFILDIDGVRTNSWDDDKIHDNVCVPTIELVKMCTDAYKPPVIFYTRNGVHIITDPFDVAKFNRLLDENKFNFTVDIKHNCPTLVYFGPYYYNN